jgi:hypothetical protein
VYHLGNGRNVEESLAVWWTTFTKARAR